MPTLEASAPVKSAPETAELSSRRKHQQDIDALAGYSLSLQSTARALWGDRFKDAIPR